MEQSRPSIYWQPRPVSTPGVMNFGLSCDPVANRDRRARLSASHPGLWGKRRKPNRGCASVRESAELSPGVLPPSALSARRPWQRKHLAHLCRLRVDTCYLNMPGRHRRAASVAMTVESMCWNVWPTIRVGRGFVGDLKLEFGRSSLPDEVPEPFGVTLWWVAFRERVLFAGWNSGRGESVQSAERKMSKGLNWELANRREKADRPDTEKRRISAWADKLLGLKGPDAPTRALGTGEIILPPQKRSKKRKR